MTFSGGHTDQAMPEVSQALGCLSLALIFYLSNCHLQWFDTVGWASGRAFGL